MYIIKPYEGKVIFRSFDQVKIFSSIEDFCIKSVVKRGDVYTYPIVTNKTPTATCQHCDMVITHINQIKRLESGKEPCEHKWQNSSYQLLNEWGDDLSVEVKAYREKNKKEGLFAFNRSDYLIKYHQKYRHYPKHIRVLFFRQLKSGQNERKQQANAQCEDIKIKIRAKRKSGNIPTNWGDIRITKQRTWKKAKVRKQWQVNLKRH